MLTDELRSQIDGGAGATHLPAFSALGSGQHMKDGRFTTTTPGTAVQDAMPTFKAQMMLIESVVGEE